MSAYSCRLPRRYRYRGRKGGSDKAAAAICAVVVLAAAAAHKGTTPAHAGSRAGTSAAIPAGPGGVPSGTLDCAGLERLWERAGGSPSAAFTAAEIAMAESAGRQYATDLNGGASTDRGYWQINSVHGSLSTYDAYGNARAAVLISNDGTGWGPWVTYQTGAYAGRC